MLNMLEVNEMLAGYIPGTIFCNNNFFRIGR